MNDGFVSEANGAMRVAINLYGQLQSKFTVTVETRDGTGLCSCYTKLYIISNWLSLFNGVFIATPAEMGSDYVPVQHDILFDEYSDREWVVYVPIINDECLEYDETFTVHINASDCVNVTTDYVTITIVNEDGELHIIRSYSFWVSLAPIFISMLFISIILFCCFLTSVAKISFNESFVKLHEDVGYVDICVVLKTDIKRDFDFNLTVYNDTAYC